MPEGSRGIACERPGTALVRAEGVALSRRGVRLIDGLDLSVPAEGVTVVMGPNGAGKSLTLRLLAGLVSPDGGSVLRAPGTRERTALVFQTPVMLRRSVRANLDHALRLARLPRAERRARIAEALALGRLEGLAERSARSLSGGEQQRVAMVRALSLRPRLLLLDEPTASLDPHSTAAVEALVGRAAAGGAAVVLVTHDAGQARRLADRVVFLDRGRVVETAEADAFFAAPASEEARAYLDGRLLL